MQPEYLLRQQDIIPATVLGTPVTIIGAGAIGSFTALALAKMGFGDIQVWDDDTVSEENMNNQFLAPSDIGQLKVVSLRNLVEQMTGTLIQTEGRRWTGQPLRSGVLITAVDSMAVRELLWAAARKQPGVRLLIDPRMGAEEIQCWAAQPQSEKDRSYGDSIYSDENAEPERCTAKATIYTVMLVSGLVARTVKGFLVEGKYPRTTQWSVANNQMLCWDSTGKKVT